MLLLMLVFFFVLYALQLPIFCMNLVRRPYLVMHCYFMITTSRRRQHHHFQRGRHCHSRRPNRVHHLCYRHTHTHLNFAGEASSTLTRPQPPRGGNPPGKGGQREPSEPAGCLGAVSSVAGKSDQGLQHGIGCHLIPQ